MKQMMKKYLYMAAVAVVGTGFLMSSCKDEFAGQNTNPSTVSKPNVRYLFTQCAMSFQPADYLQWFAGFDAMSTWVQATASGGGNSSKLNMVTQTGCGYQVNEVLRYTNEIKHQISLMSDDEKAKYEYIAIYVIRCWCTWDLKTRICMDPVNIQRQKWPVMVGL